MGLISNSSSLGLKEIILIVADIIALFIAIFITFVELRMRKLLQQNRRTLEEALIKKIEEYFQSNKSPQEKLHYLDTVAKGYFEKAFEMSHDYDYYFLVKGFTKIGKKEIASFCHSMMLAYYSSRKISKAAVDELAKKFLKILKQNNHRESLQSSFLLKKFDAFLLKMRILFIRWQEKRKKKVYSKEEMGKAGKLELISGFDDNRRDFVLPIKGVEGEEKNKSKEKEKEILERLLLEERRKRMDAIKELKEKEKLLHKKKGGKNFLEKEREEWLKDIEKKREELTSAYRSRIKKKTSNK